MLSSLKNVGSKYVSGMIMSVDNYFSKLPFKNCDKFWFY